MLKAILASLAALKEFPIIPCNLCGSQENLQRQAVKAMLNDWSERFPGRIESMFTAMQNVVPSHLADHSLFDFKNIQAGDLIDGGDTAFDQEVKPTVQAPDSYGTNCRALDKQKGAIDDCAF